MIVVHAYSTLIRLSIGVPRHQTPSRVKDHPQKQRWNQHLYRYGSYQDKTWPKSCFTCVPVPQVILKLFVRNKNMKKRDAHSPKSWRWKITPSFFLSFNQDSSWKHSCAIIVGGRVNWNHAIRLVGGFHPFETTISQNGSCPKIRVNITHCLKPAPSTLPFFP